MIIHTEKRYINYEQLQDKRSIINYITPAGTRLETNARIGKIITVLRKEIKTTKINKKHNEGGGITGKQFQNNLLSL
jgi:hypothetical protein